MTKSKFEINAQPKIRLALMEDRQGIHDAHMRSIREICVKDHGDEIKGWGYRDLGERWIKGINDKLVWVVEYNSEIHGVASFALAEDKRSAHIQALYLTPEVINNGLGKELMKLMLDEAKHLGVNFVSLDSTLTAHDFYKKHGFKDEGPVKKTPMNGIHVSSIPMRLNLNDPK